MIYNPPLVASLMREVTRAYLEAQAEAAAGIWAAMQRPVPEPRIERCDCGRPWLEDHLCSNMNQMNFGD